MTKFGKLLLVLALVAVLTIAIFFVQKKPEVVVDSPPVNGTQNEILGNKEDLISFSVLPGAKVYGIVSYEGVIKGGYFFEGNIGINILNADKNILKAGNAMATTDWMTSGPINFEGNVDFSELPKGPAYIQILQDDPRDASDRNGVPVKEILIPVIIE